MVSGKVLAAEALAAGTATTLNGASVAIARDGDGLTVNGAKVVLADVLASNGVIHAIDTVLLSPAAGPAPPVTSPPALGTIVDTAVAAGSFKTLVSLLGEAGLADTLAGPGPFTVFAPTDAAFAKLPAETVAALRADPAKLKAVLLYHVVSGKVLAAEALAAGTATTLNGASVTVRKASCHGKRGFARGRRFSWRHRTCTAIKVNDARIVATDVLASNGVIHAIDSVLLPPA